MTERTFWRLTGWVTVALLLFIAYAVLAMVTGAL